MKKRISQAGQPKSDRDSQNQPGSKWASQCPRGQPKLTKVEQSPKVQAYQTVSSKIRQHLRQTVRQGQTRLDKDWTELVRTGTRWSVNGRDLVQSVPGLNVSVARIGSISINPLRPDPRRKMADGRGTGRQPQIQERGATRLNCTTRWRALVVVDNAGHLGRPGNGRPAAGAGATAGDDNRATVGTSPSSLYGQTITITLAALRRPPVITYIDSCAGRK